MIICRTWLPESYILLDFLLSQEQLFLTLFHFFLFSTPQTSGSPGLCPWTSSVFYFLLFIGNLKEFHGFPCHPYSFCCYCSWRLKKKISFVWSIVDLQCCASISNPTPGHITGDNHNPRRYMRTCTPMFIAALFIIATAWKQPRCPLTNKWMKTVWYIYTISLSHKKERSNPFCLQRHGWT